MLSHIKFLYNLVAAFTMLMWFYDFQDSQTYMTKDNIVSKYSKNHIYENYVPFVHVIFVGSDLNAFCSASALPN